MFNVVSITIVQQGADQPQSQLLGLSHFQNYLIIHHKNQWVLGNIIFSSVPQTSLSLCCRIPWSEELLLGEILGRDQLVTSSCSSLQSGECMCLLPSISSPCERPEVLRTSASLSPYRNLLTVSSSIWSWRWSTRGILLWSEWPQWFIRMTIDCGWETIFCTHNAGSAWISMLVQTGQLVDLVLHFKASHMK